ncbi:hypothetical protein JCM8547_007301 [Rhodosporidiobolus lusitaniae]
MSTATTTTTIVCTLVSRGPSSQPGQGSELLLFAPPSRRSAGEVYPPGGKKLACVLQETLSGNGEKPPEEKELREAADGSVRRLLLLDARKDLRFVRRSKLLPWTPGTFLVAFLYRTSESYERGLEFAFAEAQTGQPEHGEGEEGRSEEAEKRKELDKAMYWITEKRLGRGSHEWVAVETVEGDLERLRHEHLSTSFSLVVLPRLLDETLFFASSLSNLSAVDVQDLALNTLLQLVRKKTGIGAFRGCWPPHVPPPSEKTLGLPEEVLKYRLMMYWRDVVAHHFKHVKIAYEPLLSAVFLRVLLPLVPLSLDSTTSLSALVQGAIDAIASEGARSRFAAANVEKLAVKKLLERASREKRKVLHVVTASGGDAMVFGVLRELVHYVSTISAHPYASTNPHIHALTHALELEWASQPNLLHLTIGESRPLNTGAVLASRLWDVSRSSRSRAAQLRALASSYDNAYLHHPLSPGTTSRRLPSGLKKRVLAGRGLSWADDFEVEQLEAEAGDTLNTYDTLDRLLKKAETAVHAQPPEKGMGGAKVRIEVAPDNALTSAMKASEGRAEDVVVLIGAEAVLPGRGGDVVASMGSWMLANMAKKLRVKVFVVAPSDSILPSGSPAPSFASHDPSELYSGWANTLAAEIEDLDPFALALGNKQESDATVWTTASEIVPGGLIDGYITEKGVLSATGCDALGKERGVAERLLYGEG